METKKGVMSGAAFVRNFRKEVISINMIDWETGQVNVQSWESCCRGGSSSRWSPNGALNLMSPHTGRGHCAICRAIRTIYYTSDLAVNPASSHCQISTGCNPLPHLHCCHRQLIWIIYSVSLLCSESSIGFASDSEWKPNSFQ